MLFLDYELLIKLSLQEFMILPVGASSFKEAMKMGVEVYHHREVGQDFFFFFFGGGGVGGLGGLGLHLLEMFLYTFTFHFFDSYSARAAM